MVRYLLRRLVLGLITLWLLATIVFAITNILPTDVGRTILGPFAPPETVAALDEKLGTNRPIPIRYIDSLTGLVTLNFGDSFVSGTPVLPQVLGAVGRSAKLAGEFWHATEQSGRLGFLQCDWRQNYTRPGIIDDVLGNAARRKL